MKDRAVKIYSWLYYYGSLFRAIQYAQYLCAYYLLKELKVSCFLNENEYQVIRLIYMEGYTSAEIARMANKSRQAVNQIKIRALKKIKNILG